MKLPRLVIGARARIALAILPCLAFAGCASDIMKSYMGQPIEMAIADYGPPTETFSLPDGRKAFQWRKVQTIAVAEKTKTEVRETRYGERVESTTTPGYVRSEECFYTLYASSYGGRWVVSGFRKPSLSCE